MKKIFKKNQIIITALAVMIAAAGYISYSDAQLKGKKDKTAKTETSSETETSVNMDQVLQDMENLDLDVTDETGAATAGDGTDATASGEESSGTESQPQETPGEAVLTGASTYMAQARIEREQIRSQNKESLLSIINNEALSETEKESAIASMVNMTDLVEKEAAAELLLEAKGFPDVVVNLTGETADIVVPDTKVDDASRAQILPKEKKQHIYYILDTDSADYDKMKQYGKHVIPFMSFRHILYSLVANLYIASDSKKHLYTWRAKPNVISNRISKHNILFLQHGVTALKRVHPIFGMKGSSPMTHFTTTSRFEHKIIVENFGYEDGDAPILGFTRWDVLEDTSKPEEKIILAMPTWRSWLEEKSAEEFKASDYYKNYMKLLQSQKLARILKENDVKLIFYIHPKFKDYLSEFNVSGDNIELIPFGTEPLNEIMKKCSMLITDYSSVCWDVCYLDKPVLFYQFDYDMYMQAHGSYLDMEHELFGERYTEYEKLIDGIEEYIHNEFKEKEEYTKLKDYYFEYRDNDNSKRTYEYIISKGY